MLGRYVEIKKHLKKMFLHILQFTMGYLNPSLRYGYMTILLK